MRSPLAGLVKCANCGQNMQRMVMKGSAYLLCTRRGCCASTKIDFVESQILEYLTDTLAKLTMDQPQHIPGRDTSVLETSLEQIKDALAGTDRQKNRLYELLELGEYDLPLFRERMAAVKEKRASLEKKEAERPGRLRHRRRRREKRPAQIRPGVGLVQKREENQARRLPTPVRPPSPVSPDFLFNQKY